jgi:hypothetical protein
MERESTNNKKASRMAGFKAYKRKLLELVLGAA